MRGAAFCWRLPFQRCYELAFSARVTRGVFIQRAVIMAFPPNYNLERNNRARAKAEKLAEKQARKAEKAAQRDEPAAPAETDKDTA